MTLPSSGPLSLSQIRDEFGGGGTVSLSAFYAGGGRVPGSTSGVPGSGALSFSEFLGKQNALEIFSLTIGDDSAEWGYLRDFGIGSLSPGDCSFAPGDPGVYGIIWLSANNSFHFILDGGPYDQSIFASLVVNGNSFTSASASFDGNGEWVWTSGNPLGTSGTVTVTFH